MRFNHTIFSSLSAPALWRLVRLSFEDSTVSPLWPNELMILRCSALAVGKKVKVKFRAAPFKGRTCDLEVADYKFGAGFALHLADGRPFHLEALIETTPSAHGSMLRITGGCAPRLALFSLPAWLGFTACIEGRLFARIRRNLAGHELKKDLSA